ncbi:HAD family hydrolase [archaeon]|nr:HAD family hydrolase [archaeon]
MKLFIWDFHGVLEEGNEDAVIEISNIVLEAFGYQQRLDADICRQLNGRHWYEYFTYILPNEPHERHLELQAAGAAYSQEHHEVIAKHIRPNRYARQVLSTIRAAGHGQAVISNTQSIDMFLRLTGLQDIFSEGRAMQARPDTPGCYASKQEALRLFLAGKMFDRIIGIGDSPTDVKLVEAYGGTTYLYAHPGIPFRDCKADYKINDLRDVLREI